MIVFIQNDPEVPPGIYAEGLAEKRIPFAVVESFRNAMIPPLAAISAVVVLGGSMGVHDAERHPFLLHVKDFIRTVLDCGKPYLGICLGGQLLADVLESRVSSGLNAEIGTHSIGLTEEGTRDPLFQSVPDQFITFQWHNDSFAIPQGAVRLAASHACPNQAFRFGHTAYGLQFHPEVNEEIVTAWCRGFDSGGTPPLEIVSNFRNSEDNYRQVSLRILDNFLEIVRKTR